MYVQLSSWYILIIFMLSSHLCANMSWQKSPEIRSYLKSNFPHLITAIKNGSYADLQAFDRRLFLGKNINKEFGPDTSFVHGVLVGAKWGRERNGRPHFDLSFSDISFARFKEADMRDTKLSYAKAFEANLKYSKLNCQNIKGADFTGANLKYATIFIDGNEFNVSAGRLEQCGAIADSIHSSGENLSRHTVKKEEPSNTVILDFTASKKTWSCHWFPLEETRPGGDPINNLYAVNGPLDKLDQLTGSNARKFEDENFHKVSQGNRSSWWGHCSNASEAACILEEPKHGVTMIDKSGNPIRFDINDIKGLLVKCIPDLVDKVDFRGNRFNDPERDNPHDSTPEMFIAVIQEWAKDGLPFVLDIDAGEQARNYPYDRVRIFESDKAPEGFAAPSDGDVKYYRIEMSGTGYEDKQLVYMCYIKRSNGSIVSSGWIKTQGFDGHPDFMWRPRCKGDIMLKSTWQKKGDPRASNPEVDPQEVYEIYRLSAQ
jgi:hypothetical protein